MTTNEEKVRGTAVLEFITVANELCLFMEGNEKYDKATTLAYLQKVLPLLYIKGALLPQVEPPENTIPQHFITEENWDNLYSRMKEKLGKDDGFFLTRHDEIYGVKPGKASIAEGLSDIYQDIKDFLVYYQQNTLTARQGAVHECQRLFETRWGHRLASIHAAIHKVLYGNIIEDNSIPGEEVQ